MTKKRCAKPRAKSKTRGSRSSVKRVRFFISPLWSGIAVIVLLAVGAFLYLGREAYWIKPGAGAKLPAGKPLFQQTLSLLQKQPRLPSLRVEKTEPVRRKGVLFYSAELSLASETEIILAEQAIEEFWREPSLQVEVSVVYPEEAAKGTSLLMASRGGQPLLLVRLLWREPLPEPGPLPEPAPPQNHGRIAIVIDDVGNSLEAARQLAELPAAVTLAIIPFTPYAEEAQSLALKAGKEVALHLPMEPQDYPLTDPGPGALFLSMSAAEMEQAVLSALEEVPQAACVNNHMGSALTENPAAMSVIMRILKPRGVCFLDSRTSAHSAAQEEAERAGVPNTRRDVFLDNDRRPLVIRKQLIKLTRLASEHGQAVGIGHPYPETIQVLAESLPHLQKLGYEVVPLSHLANPR